MSTSALLNRQPAERNETAVQMLREKQLKKYTPVWTADDQELGNALRLRHRQTDIDPEMKLYESYLEVYSMEIGTRDFVPCDFIASFDPEIPRVTLAVPMQTVMAELWDREPTFIAGRQDLTEELPT